MTISSFFIFRFSLPWLRMVTAPWSDGRSESTSGRPPHRRPDLPCRTVRRKGLPFFYKAFQSLELGLQLDKQIMSAFKGTQSALHLETERNLAKTISAQVLGCALCGVRRIFQGSGIVFLDGLSHEGQLPPGVFEKQVQQLLSEFAVSIGNIVQVGHVKG
jgi:hypothetical protein